MCPSLKTNAVSDPMLRTTGNRDADRDKTHDTSWKNASKGASWIRNTVSKTGLILLDLNPQATKRQKDESQADFKTPSSDMDITIV